LKQLISHSAAGRVDWCAVIISQSWEGEALTTDQFYE